MMSILPFQTHNKGSSLTGLCTRHSVSNNNTGLYVPFKSCVLSHQGAGNNKNYSPDYPASKIAWRLTEMIQSHRLLQPTFNHNSKCSQAPSRINSAHQSSGSSLENYIQIPKILFINDVI